MNVVLLFGGIGEEYEISLRSAAAVLASFPHTHTVFKVGIGRTGEWYLTEATPRAIERDRWLEGARPAMLCPATHSITVDGEQVPCDVVLPILHGGLYEGGGAAAICQALDLPYVGCPPLAGALAMDKVLSKTVAASLGIRVAKGMCVFSHEVGDPSLADRLGEALGYPLFVKPPAGGSSVGACRVDTPDMLEGALSAAFLFGDTALCEEYIHGREVEFAILEDEGVLRGHEVGEIDPGAPFYDYDAKYRDRTSRIFIPARVPSASRMAVREAGRAIFRALGCRGLARVDFFVLDSGELVFNEINTMPGFTDISMYPMLLSRLGLSLGDVVDVLLKNAKR